MLGELTGEDEADGGLDLAGRERRLLVVAGELGRLGGDLLEDVVDEGVHDGHRLGGDAGVGVHLLEDLVDVDLVRLGLGLLAALLAALEGLLGGLLGGGLGHFDRVCCCVCACTKVMAVTCGNRCYSKFPGEFGSVFGNEPITSRNSVARSNEISEFRNGNDWTGQLNSAT